MRLFYPPHRERQASAPAWKDNGIVFGCNKLLQVAYLATANACRLLHHITRHARHFLIYW